MLRSAIAISAVLAPSLAFAQAPGQVPAVNAVAAAGISSSTTPSQATGVPNMTGATVGSIPPGMPPPVVHKLAPDPQLNKKEVTASNISAAWRNHYDPPQRGEDGTIRWVYGASLPSIVCSPLRSCDLALEPGEVVNNVNVGDKIRWLVTPAVTGVGPDRVTHVVIKPVDSGLVSSLTVYTDRRMYSIQLKSTQTQWTAMTAFTYPEDAKAAWAAYGATMSSSNSAPTPSHTSYSPGGVQFYSISGSAPWKPIRAYASGGKTIIQFRGDIQYGTAPALVGLGSGGGWFSSAPEQMLQYRVRGDSMIVDGVIDRAKLVAGVGSGQQRVDIERGQ